MNTAARFDTVNSEDFSFRVPDIRCAACALRIERQLLKLPGVTRCRTHLPTKRVIVDGQGLDADTVENCIRDLGFTPGTWNERETQSREQEEKRAMLARLGVAGIGMMQVMMYALADYLAGEGGMEPVFEKLFQWASLGVSVPIVLYSARPFYANAWRDLKARSVGMDVPVSLAILAAFSLSTINLLAGRGQVYFDSVCMFTFLLLLGRTLEMSVRHQYQDSLDLSDSCLPLTALDAETGEPVLVKKIVPGERFRVLPGSMMPADGRVVSGLSQVSEAAFTGESLPVTRAPGSRVLAGSQNLDGELLIEADTAYADFVIRKMNAHYQEASLYKPAFSVLADRLARWFVGTVLLLALGSALFWALLGSGAWFEIGLTVLVVSCPCALSLATPVAYTVALTTLRRLGIIVSSGRLLEKLSRVDTLIFDKTGTVTMGRLEISRVDILDQDLGEAEILALCSALETPSRHPIARAFAHEHACQVENPQVVPGQGVSGVIDGCEYRLGKAEFAWPQAAADASGHEGIRVLLAAERPLAWIFLRDALRGDLEQVVTALKPRFRLGLLTGDRDQEADRVSALAGIDVVKSEASPDDKLAIIRGLQDEGHKVLMVGDGLNDAAAMAAAHASLAVSPVDIVVQEAAEATLLRNDLMAVKGLLDYAQKARRVITQNILWAAGYNLLAIPLAMAGVLQPWMAALGMSASSLIVVLNANRLHGADGTLKPVGG